VLREQTDRPTDPQALPATRLAGPAQLLDRGTSAPLYAAVRDGGKPLAEQAFEHGRNALIDGTAAPYSRGVSALRPGALVEVAVTDRQRDPSSQHEAIFGDFHRAYPGGPFAGTGLGLSVSGSWTDTARSRHRGEP
jgi:hypothetical protein